MMPTDPIQNLLSAARQDQDILAVFLFGSRARNEQRPDSDTDICLVLMPHVGSAKAAFDKRLAYMSDFDFDIHIYQSIPLYIRQRVLAEGKILYCRSEDMLYETAFKTITEFADFEHIYRDYLKEIERG